jgi:hypothetical protein
MELLKSLEHEEFLKNIIDKYGYAVEHNYYNYIYNCDSGEEPFFFKFNDFEIILLFYSSKDKVYRLYSSIIAQSERRLACLVDFLDYIISRGAKKVEIETDESFRTEMVENFKLSGKYVAKKPVVRFTWPVFNVVAWDGDKMQGKDWKDMRNYWNKYFREHKVEFKLAQDFDKSILKKLVLKWKKQRTGERTTFYKCYLNAIENGFKGFKTRIMVVDEEVVAITAGFKIPNKNYYYSAIGVYSRDIDRTGEICNMDDLLNLKKDGYEFVDFGGGEPTLTTFKKKFHPNYYYDTQVFYIWPVKKK